jgi:hypothetical protein
MGIYLLIVVLSVVSCFIGFALQCARDNITHLENGREPNAGAALFPDIPMVPCSYLLAAWLMNEVFQNSGFVIVISYFCIASGIKAFQYKKLKHELLLLKKQRSG